jgi:hypothetical protein
MKSCSAATSKSIIYIKYTEPSISKETVQGTLTTSRTYLKRSGADTCVAATILQEARVGAAGRLSNVNVDRVGDRSQSGVGDAGFPPQKLALSERVEPSGFSAIRGKSRFVQ